MIQYQPFLSKATGNFFQTLSQNTKSKIEKLHLAVGFQDSSPGMLCLSAGYYKAVYFAKQL